LIEETVAGSATDAARERLKITEIFFSIQGEALFSGMPTAFVRLTGCPMRCRYCDTAYAFGGGYWWTVERILDDVARYGTQYVCVTGGEPLAQPRCGKLLTALSDSGYRGSVETGGAIDIGQIDERVCRVMDIKTPGSGEVDKNHWENLAALRETDALKFVICDRQDFDWARGILLENPDIPCEVFFSSSYEELAAGALADWILEHQLAVRLQVQLHKTLWGDVAGR